MSIPSAGYLDERIELIHVSHTIGTSGQRIPVYNAYARVHCHITHAHGARAISQGETYATDSISVLMRYNHAVSEGDVIRWDGRLYQVQGRPVGSRREGSLTIEASYIDAPSKAATINPISAE